MSGVVHFKFKSAISYDSVQFDGAFVTVGELKNLIADKRGLAREATAELILSDPRTNAEYKDDAQQLQRSTSVLVRRAPAARLRPLEGGAEQPLAASAAHAPASRPAPAAASFPSQRLSSQQHHSTPQDGFGADLYAQQPASAPKLADDGDGLASRLAAEGATWQQELAAGRGRGRARGRGRGGYQIPPPNYVCFRCNQTGHFIGDCPTNGDPEFDRKRIRNPVGIPLSRLGVTAEGGLHLPGGQVGSLIPNEDVFQREMFGSAAPAGKPTPAPSAAPQQQVAAPASGPLMLDSKPHTEEPSSSAMVLFTAPDAGPPALAGEDQLFQALAQPVAKPQPKPDVAPALPLPMPFLPGQAPPFPLPTFAPALGQPMSKEEFERLRKDASRKKRRSASRGSSRSRSRSPGRRSRRRRSRTRSSSDRSSRSPERRRRGKDTHRHRAASSRLGRRDPSVSPEPPLRMPRQEPFQRRWRPPPAVSDSPLRYGSRARAKRALSPGGLPVESGDPQGERLGPVIDRWEPGSDFESSKPAQRAGKRKLNGVDSSAPAGRPATPQPVRSSGASPVAATGNAIGPARSDRSLDRGVPEPASLPAEPIALLDDMDSGVSFSKAAAAVQQPKPKEGGAEGKARKHKKDKHKKEGKERKHKKHKKVKKGEGDKEEEDQGSEMEEAAKEPAPVKESSGTVRPNPRLFQISQAAAVSAARSASEKAKSRA